MRNDPHVADGVRLQKVLAQAGVASRRASEELIASGRVQVDGKVVRTLGVRIDPDYQIIHVDGERLILNDHPTIVMAFNKPVGVVSTMSDPEGRPCLGDFLQDYPERLYHVGRLDIDTSGVLLLTNEGELANRLAHPRYGVQKTYVARVVGNVKGGVRRRLLNGVELEDGVAKADSFRVMELFRDVTTVEITLHEGRHRIVRRMLDAVGHPVRELTRTKFGPITVDRQRQGTMKRLSEGQLRALYSLVDL